MKTLLLLSTSVALAAAAWMSLAPAPSVEPERPVASRRPVAQRTLDLLTIEPSLDRSEVDALLAESDQVRAAVHADGETDVGQAVLAHLAAVEVDEADALAYYRERRDLFGGRSFEASRWTIQQLIAIERTRAEFGLR